MKILQLLNILGISGLLLVNLLANTVPINQQTTGEVSREYNTFFTPAEYTFSIWVFIYLGLLGFSIYQSRGLFHRHGLPSHSVAVQFGITFFISCLANIAWIFSWHYQYFLSTLIFMTILLLTLIDINIRIYKMEKRFYLFYDFYWLVKVPFGLYLGWVSIATISNMAVYLNYQEWSRVVLNESIWSTFFIVSGGLAALWMLARMRLVTAAVAIAWGIIGVLFHQWQDSLFFSLPIMASLVMIALIFIGVARVMSGKQLV